MSTPDPDLAAFMSTSAKKLSKCSSCSSPKRAAPDSAMRAFAAAKESGETTQEWQAFHQFLVSKYNYLPGIQSMRRHMKDCLELI